MSNAKQIKLAETIAAAIISAQSGGGFSNPTKRKNAIGPVRPPGTGRNHAKNVRRRAKRRAKAAVQMQGVQTALVPVNKSQGHRVLKRSNNLQVGPSSLIRTRMEKLLMCFMAPDQCDAVRFGKSSSPKTAAFKWHHEWIPLWDGGTSQSNTNDFVTGELWCALLPKNHNCAMVYNELLQNTRTKAIGSPVQGWTMYADQGSPLEFAGAKLGAAGEVDSTFEPTFLDNDTGNSMLFVNNHAGGGANTTFTITLSTGGVFANAVVYALGVHIKEPGQDGVATITFAGNGTATSPAITATTAGYQSFTPVGPTNPNTGTWTSTASPGLTTSWNQQIDNITFTEQAGSNICHLPSPGFSNGALNQLDSLRTNCMMVEFTQMAPILNEEGGCLGAQIPEGQVFWAYCNDSSTPTSMFNKQLANETHRLLDAKRGIVEFWHPGSIRDESMTPIGIAGEVSNVNVPAPVPFTDLTGGVIICIKTAVALNAGRDGMLRAYWLTEGESDSQNFTYAGPDYTPGEVEQAMYLLKQIAAGSENPNHVVAALSAAKNVTGKAGRVLGPAGLMAGAALMSNPATALPGAITMGAGAVGTLLGELF